MVISSFNVHVSPWQPRCWLRCSDQWVGHGRGLVEWALTNDEHKSQQALINPNGWFYVWIYLTSICTCILFSFMQMYTPDSFFTLEAKEISYIMDFNNVEIKISSSGDFSHESFTNIPRMTAIKTCDVLLFIFVECHSPTSRHAECNDISCMIECVLELQLSHIYILYRKGDSVNELVVSRLLIDCSRQFPQWQSLYHKDVQKICFSSPPSSHLLIYT